MGTRMRVFVLAALPLWICLTAEAGAIHEAVTQGDLQAVKDLLAKDPKLVAAEDKNRETPLHEAARRGHKAIAALLIAAKADLNARNNRVYWDATPMMYAAAAGHRDVLELLLAKGADPSHQKRTWRVSALHEAVGRNDIETVRILLKYKANPNVIRWNYTAGAPIHEAKGEEMLKILLDHGADINAADRGGRTVLHHAVRWGRAKRVAFLLARRADPNAGDSTGCTPLHLAAAGDDRKLPILKQLLAAGGDANAADFSGATPPHAAAKRGTLKGLQALLAGKADLSVTTRAGQTVLHFAAGGKGRLEVVKRLLARRLDANVQDRAGRTALHEAARAGDRAVVELLLAGRADPIATDSQGRQPLHEASRMGHAEAAKAILAAGAKPGAADLRGQTPLYVAARGGHKPVVEALLAAGADVNKANRYDETPLFAARARGHGDVVKVLVAKGARDVCPLRPGGRPGAPARGPKAILAEFIVSRLKMRRGLALDLGCGDGALAVEVAKRTGLRLTCLDPDPKTVARARDRVEAAGMYGTRVAADVGGLGKLAYPTGSANLIICGDEFAAGLRGRSLGEMYRVLSPNGVAVIGQSPAVAAKDTRLTAGQLAGWLKAAGIGTYEIVKANGVWACIAKPRPKGADEWRHRYHDPGNTHGSNDRLIGSPLRSQWVADWRAGDSAASFVAGDGRVFLASLEHQTRRGYASVRTRTPYLRAIDAYTGIELWVREEAEELPLDRSQRNYGAIQVDVALAGESLYLLGGRACYEFDVATGNSRALLGIPAEAEPDTKDIWLYLSSVGDLLYGSSGPPTNIRGSWDLKYPRGNSKVVFAIDRRTRKLRWISRKTAMTGSLAIGGGKMFYCDPGYGLHALDANTGKEIWANEQAGFAPKVDIVRGAYYAGKYWLVYHPTSGRFVNTKGRAARAKLSSDSTRNAREVAAFSAADGRRLFECPLGKGIAGVSFSGGTVYGASQHSSRGRLSAVDAETGTLKWTVGAYFKCSPITSAVNAVFARSYVARCLDVRPWNRSKDAKSLRWYDITGYRSTCTYPGIPANGMLYIQGPGCNCPHPVRANSAMVQGRPAPKDPTGRLVKGPAFGRDIAPPTDKHPWRTWRANARRSAVSAEPVADPGAFKKLWTVKLGGDLSPVAAAGGTVYVGSTDGLVRAIDAATGKAKWRYFAKGRVAKSLWLWRGRLYFGDDGGWVHCVRADSGELIWRFRGAPARERVVSYGRYASRWPVRGGVLVAPAAGADPGGATLYCSVGFFPTEGCYSHALDARTGEVRWETTHRGFTPRGPMAMGGGRLYAPSGWGPPFAVRLDDKQHTFRQIRQSGSATSFTGADGMSVTEPADEVLMRQTTAKYVHWRGTFVIKAADPALPIVTAESIYLHGRYLSAQRREAFAISPNGRLYRKDSRWSPDIVRWQAWKGIPMTAIAKAGGTIFTGGSDAVFVTADADGKEMCRVPVPGEVESLAFNGGRLFAVCKGGQLVCLGPAAR